MLFSKSWQIFGPMFKNLLVYCLPNKFSICSQIYRSGIRRPWPVSVADPNPHWFNADPDTDPDIAFFLIRNPGTYTDAVKVSNWIYHVQAVPRPCINHHPIPYPLPPTLPQSHPVPPLLPSLSSWFEKNRTCGESGPLRRLVTSCQLPGWTGQVLKCGVKISIFGLVPTTKFHKIVN